ncbi:MAG: ABC transporter substrate-binding protein [Planctomycetota bacterium]
MNRFFAVLAVLAAAIVLFLILATSGGIRDEASFTLGAMEAANASAKIAPGSSDNTTRSGRQSPLAPEEKESLPKVLRLALDTEPKTLDPIAITDTISDGVAHKIHNSLVRFCKDMATGNLTVEGDLAERFDISPDGKIYTFILRKGVRFHNGRELKAQDVVYSLSRLLAPESKRPEWLKPFVVGSEERYKNSQAPLGIKAISEYIVMIELNRPFAPFIQHLCTSNCSIVPQEAVEDARRPFARNPVGVGAFTLKEWRDNEVLILTRNEDYFKGKPKLSKIKFFIMKEPNTRLENFFAGELDASDIPYGRVKDAKVRAGADHILEYDTFRTNYLGIGFPNGEFKNRKELSPFGVNKLVRQAMAYALDREYLCDRVLEGRGIPAKSILPPKMPGYKEDRSGWPKNIAKAKALLAQAGFPDGQGLPPMTILHRNDENTKKLAQVLALDLEKIGLTIELQAREWNSFLEMVEIEPRPLFLLGWVADYPDPDNFLYVLFHSAQWGAPGNHTWYSNPEVDRLTEQARNTLDLKARISLYQKAEDILLDECPWICTYHVRNVVLLRKEIRGIRENVTPLDTGTEFPQVDFGAVDIETTTTLGADRGH